MDLVIYVNEEFEDEKALYDLDEGKVLLQGDQYHDGIGSRIAGYLDALHDYGIYMDYTNKEWINKNHEHFKLLGFYSE
ncbi:hypothetical protein [Paenibacillus sp. 1781tsa1]|uniref:hypothetical protein n=1 Tax=Paenibacillus sp. 1781tsa1 TaxID=2953810 RepID=UPI00209EE85A|nr:hypothetical protein [Paenibacillus sp. 1781tsa1]MCP1184946.1 hypothetical protein [Paenibacillus sp. 1781tsa1]